MLEQSPPPANRSSGGALALPGSLPGSFPPGAGWGLPSSHTTRATRSGLSWGQGPRRAAAALPGPTALSSLQGRSLGLQKLFASRHASPADPKRNPSPFSPGQDPVPVPPPGPCQSSVHKGLCLHASQVSELPFFSGRWWGQGAGEMSLSMEAQRRRAIVTRSRALSHTSYRTRHGATPGPQFTHLWGTAVKASIPWGIGVPSIAPAGDKHPEVMAQLSKSCLQGPGQVGREPSDGSQQKVDPSWPQ